MNNRILVNGIFAAVLAALSACGPRAQIQPEFEQGKVQTVALLPIRVPLETRDERRRFLRSAFESELASRGYQLLDENLIAAICADVECAERAQLASRYPVSAFVEVSINGIERNNFVLGFYNAIEGTLLATTPEGKTIAQVEFTESKRGGLVFDSGQVIQAIKEQYENYGDWNFNSLASGFAQEVVAELPKIAASDSETFSAAPTIQEVSVVPRRAMVDQVCVSGTPGLRALLFLNRSMTNLRETQPGLYCGAYRLPQEVYQERMLTVELRSAFGTSVRKAFNVDDSREASAAFGAQRMSGR
ncbi:MAG: hypothetical protein KDD66_14460 [Bdellovibrionales bacterium]|nr:hypothetical protein [Bdellovibrionales bacterium]